MLKLTVLFGAIITAAGPALAGAPVPGPLAGASFGPLGLVVAGVGYVAYRVIKARSDR
jgi:hypothetical protein